MLKTLHINKSVLSLGVSLVMITFLAFLAQSPLFNNDASTLSIAITADLLFTVPLIYYLLIRNTEIPKTTIVPVLIVGVIAGTYTIPEAHQSYLTLFKTWGLPLVELLVLIFVITKIRTLVQKYKQEKSSNPDFFSLLKEAASELLPQRIVPIFATEIAVIYYGFIHWKKPIIKENDFTHHKTSGTPILLMVVVFLVMVETFAVHILVARWSDMAAWVLTILGIYTGIQLFGFAKSLSQRPITIEDNHLILRYGILAEVVINMEDIVAVDLSKKSLKADGLTRKLSTFEDLESHNTIIKLKKEYTLVGIYGIKKKFTNLAIYVDDKEAFKNKLDTIISTK